MCVYLIMKHYFIPTDFKLFALWQRSAFCNQLFMRSMRHFKRTIQQLIVRPGNKTDTNQYLYRDSDVSVYIAV